MYHWLMYVQLSHRQLVAYLDAVAVVVVIVLEHVKTPVGEHAKAVAQVFA